MGAKQKRGIKMRLDLWSPYDRFVPALTFEKEDFMFPDFVLYR